MANDYYGPVDSSGRPAKYETKAEYEERKRAESLEDNNDYGNVVYAANGSDFPQTYTGGRGYLDALMGIEDGYRVKPRQKTWMDETTSVVLDPPMSSDGDAYGLRIVYMEDDGTYKSPLYGSVWEGGRMNNAWAANPNHPNCQKILDYYARKVCELGKEPLQAVVSISGRVNLMDNGGMVAQELQILQVQKYYEE